MLGIERISTFYGSVCNGIPDDDTCVDNLYPTYCWHRYEGVDERFFWRKD